MAVAVALNKGAYTLVDEQDFCLAIAYKRHVVNGTCGVRYAYRGKTYEPGNQKKLGLHREIMGLDRGDRRVVDHINGDGLDNRRCNLRVVEPVENARNTRTTRVNRKSSPFLGVRRRPDGRYVAFIGLSNKEIYLGHFETAEQANEARIAAENQYWGEARPRRLETAGA